MFLGEFSLFLRHEKQFSVHLYLMVIPTFLIYNSKVNFAGFYVVFSSIPLLKIVNEFVHNISIT